MSHLNKNETPQDVKNAKGIHLITQSTPNGQKVQIFLEELGDAYNFEWTTTLINISTNEQKKDWFLRLNPNGRIPVIIDNTQNSPFPVMETSAELLYLLSLADKDHLFSFTDPLEHSQCVQWLFLWHGSGAPYHGQVIHFVILAKEKLPYVIERFTNELLRVFDVLEIQLSGKYNSATGPAPREYLAGQGTGKYSVADMGTWPWVKLWEFTGITEKQMDQFPHLRKWLDRIEARPPVQRAMGDKYKQK
ncbi:hypothetical protein LTR10_018675 [Elasticomyces elasticus]|uniref:Glutathione S-transferase n=1 Tax=Exophiala sideris TaxID=1016849 RepID=A0ABR0JS58_9EURO|nr:hypothetical protein LTR10_018675 [Elasticomyces elasticus]KAK5040422.1 hypothetical protein LTS07_000920 [Exophiala sideris]KAK5043152.1 hypothetical protein LTR13_000923 [Exophiala sideris]KAK5068800.1 hypothetical protein LTR69_000921 [Exophiala sideris]KAK5186397.1 hypothetical protein LTR44_001453 [Eurotiomycetes sp. CCFEE 6388]